MNATENIMDGEFHAGSNKIAKEILKRTEYIRDEFFKD